MVADDSGTLYVDNTQMFNVVVPNIASTTISASSSLLAVLINNAGGFGGAILSSTYGGCITDTVSWRCTNVSYAN